MALRFRRAPPDEKPVAQLHDPPALEARPGSLQIEEHHMASFADMWRPHNFTVDLIKSILSAPKVLPAILPALVPYTLVVAAFGAFIAWNGGIVLGQFL